jgi:flagellin
MSLTVNINPLAKSLRNHATEAQDEMGTALERLASGKRINGAVDDASGLALVTTMEAQVRGLAQAVRNAGDAISLVQTAEGAIQEYEEILQRIRELAIQAGGGAPSDADRVNINQEVTQLTEELARIADSTRFNGEQILNGSMANKDFQIGQSNIEEISVNVANLRPETIGIHTQESLTNIGKISVGGSVSSLTNGVSRQTLTVDLESQPAKSVLVDAGDSARTVADSLNQLGLQLTATASTALSVHLTGDGSFSFSVSTSLDPSSSFLVAVGSTVPSKTQALADEINANSAQHQLSASVETDGSGNEYVRIVQPQGYDIRIDSFVTGGTTGLDFDGDGAADVDGTGSKSAAIAGGQVVIDTSETFSISSDDSLYTVLTDNRTSATILGIDQLDLTKGYKVDWFQQGIVSDSSYTFMRYDRNEVHIAEDWLYVYVGNLIEQGDLVKYYAIDGESIGGLTSGQSYYIIKPPSGNDFIRLALTREDALAATYIDGAEGSYVDLTSHGGRYHAVGYVCNSALRPTQFSISVDDQNFVDVNIQAYATELLDPVLGLAGATPIQGGVMTLTKEQFVSVLQTAIDDTPEFSGSDAIQVSVTDAGILELKLVNRNPDKIETVSRVSQIDVSSRAGASSAIKVVDAALNKVATARGDLGAVANRLESTISNLMNVSENTSWSMSRVIDADYAAESTRLARAQIIQQASVAMLAQANIKIQEVLKLLGQ